MADEHRRIPLLGLDRPLPHNEEAEIAVLGAILLDPGTAAEIAVTRLAFEGSFFRPVHQLVFDTVAGLWTEGQRDALDLITVADALERQGRLEDVGGRAYLSQLLHAVPTAAHIEQYVDIVRQNAVLRRLIRAGVSTVDRCFQAGDDIAELIDSIEREILEITGMRAESSLKELSHLVMPAVDYLDRLYKGEQDTVGIPSGFADLDKMLTGLRPGEMVVLAARPSIGKTALALNMAANIAIRGKQAPVGIFSLEMGADQLVLRLLCSEARVSVADIRDGAVATSRWDDIMASAQRFREANVVIDDTGAIDLMELRAKARRMHREQGIQVLFVDYLQLINVSSNRNATRENDVARISGQLKALAKELKIPVVVLAQLNRQAEQSGQKPRLGHLRESGAIEQDADVVGLLHRDRDAQTQLNDPHAAVDAEIIIAKHRNGPTGRVPLRFFPAYTRFESASAIDDDDVPVATA